ncbi:MAG: hypothetical protein QM645_06270 [Asticcacaulis sp.]
MKRFNIIIPALMVLMAGLAIGVWFYYAPPDLALIGQQAFAVRLHLGAALMALGLGTILLMAPKGILPHRLMGWVWVALMLVTAVSSFYIREINSGGLSLIHALSGWTTIAAPMLVWFARCKRVGRHRLSAYCLYFGGLVVAGLFTFVPGRLMWQVVFG